MGMPMFTCSICGRITYAGTWGLCTEHYKEYSMNSTYSEVTVTGTYGLPEWVRIFAAEHHADEQRLYHREYVFSDFAKEKPVSVDLTGRVRRRGGWSSVSP